MRWCENEIYPMSTLEFCTTRDKLWNYETWSLCRIAGTSVHLPFWRWREGTLLWNVSTSSLGKRRKGSFSQTDGPGERKDFLSLWRALLFGFPFSLPLTLLLKLFVQKVLTDRSVKIFLKYCFLTSVYSGVSICKMGDVILLFCHLISFPMYSSCCGPLIELRVVLVFKDEQTSSFMWYSPEETVLYSGSGRKNWLLSLLGCM